MLTASEATTTSNTANRNKAYIYLSDKDVDTQILAAAATGAKSVVIDISDFVGDSNLLISYLISIGYTTNLSGNTLTITWI